MKKLFIITVLLATLFLFRGQIIDYSVQFYGQDDEQVDWLTIQRADLNSDLPSMDFNSAITALFNFENEITNSLQAPQDPGGNSSHSHRRQLLCELALVYKQMAIQYLRNGNDDLYIEYTRKSQKQLTECSTARELSE